MKSKFRERIAKLINYFLKGLLIVIPFAITYYIIKYIVLAVDNYVNVGIPAAGFFIVITSITLLGVIGSSIFTKPLFALMDQIVSRIPFVKLIYSSTKELMEAFVGDKRKFDKPVIVEMAPGIFKPGFITQTDLTDMNLDGLVAVYLPHSYNFSGNVFLVAADKIRPFDSDPTNVMKFIVSGGVTHID